MLFPLRSEADLDVSTVGHPSHAGTQRELAQGGLKALGAHEWLFAARSSRVIRFNPGKPIFLLFSGNEFYYTNALILPVKRICVVIFIARNQRKIDFPG